MKDSKIVIFGALTANLLIAIVKFIAAYFSGSSSMISEGVHSLVDTSNEILLLVGMKRSKIPPNRMHRFGHGKEIYFWSLIVSILIFGLGGGISIYEGITHIMTPTELTDPTWNYVVLGCAFVFEAISFAIGMKTFLSQSRTDHGFFKNLSRSKDPGLFVVIYEDGAALLGLMIAGGGVYTSHVTGNEVYDGCSSILIGIVLACVAIILIKESRDLLLGESADQDILEGIRDIVSKETEVEEIKKLKTMHFGPDNIFLVLEVHFAWDQGYPELVKLTSGLKEAIHGQFPGVQEIYIEAV